MWGEIRVWFYKAYVFFWKDFLCRTEQFTDQWIRMAKKWPWFWIIMLALFVIAYVVFILLRAWETKKTWLKVLAMMGLVGLVIFLFWLAFHLGGFV